MHQYTINPQFPSANTHANSYDYTHHTYVHINAGSKALAQILTKNGHLLEERLIHLPLSDGAAHEDPPVGVPVYGPQLHG